MKTAIWLKIKTTPFYLGEFSEKLTFYNIYEIQLKLTSNHACHCKKKYMYVLQKKLGY